MKDFPDATEILLRLWGNEPGFLELVEEAKAVRTICDLLREVRQKRGMTQTELAKRVGTTQSAISRMEEADHSIKLATVLRVAAALDRRVEIRLTEKR